MKTTRIRPQARCRRAAWFVVLGCIVVCVAGPARSQERPENPAPDDPAADPMSGRSGRLAAAAQSARQNPDQLLKNAWWNQEAMVESLSLRAQQRGRMDAAMTAFFAEQASRTEARRVATQRYYEALEAGDIDVARERIAALVEASGQFVEATAEMRVGILAALDVPQLEKLRSEHPQVVRGRWIQAPGQSRSSGPGAGSGRRAPFAQRSRGSRQPPPETPDPDDSP